MTAARPWRRGVPDFCAIDFETANEHSNSACALGVARVAKGRVVATATWLVRPPFRRFEYKSIHGIGWRAVKTAPTLAELWPAVEPWIKGCRFLAAHNAAFDKKVLAASLEPAQADASRLPPFLCTVALARFMWGTEHAGLARVARALKIPLVHHDPASDARACAEIILHAQRDWWRSSATSLDLFELCMPQCAR